jgi:hypothetical protein
MSSLFSSPKMPAPTAVPATPTTTDPSVVAAAAAMAREQAQAQGARSTLLTSGQGATDPLTVQRKTLLGR